MPTVGFLHAAFPGPFAAPVTAFRDGLKETGYVEGQNVAIEYRWAENRYDRLPTLAADLVGRRVAAIAAFGDISPVAAKAATSTIPIVFMVASDPVKSGLVASLNRPGGNLTGINMFVSALMPKRMEFLSELVPKAAIVALLVNQTNPNADVDIGDAEVAGRTLGRQIEVLTASTANAIDIAFATMSQRRIGALVTGNDVLFTTRHTQIVALAGRYAIPAIYAWREFVTAGGLASYGIVHTEPYRQAGLYVGRILKGEKPTDLPVMQPTKFELVINLKTAKALGLTVPLIMQMTADEVIE
jgi:putative ABC transport system substrate-binding protein